MFYRILEAIGKTVLGTTLIALAVSVIVGFVMGVVWLIENDFGLTLALSVGAIWLMCTGYLYGDELWDDFTTSISRRKNRVR